MKTDVTTPQGIFGMPQHLTVPIYQRPYVWTEDEQWGPLWADVRRIAEHRLGDQASSATHFLGAVVTQQAESAPVGVQEFLIVDGQQRLTTLQLLLDATAASFGSRGLDALRGQLEFLTHNSSMFIGAGGPSLKLRHTNRDRAAFDEVMTAEPPVQYKNLRNRDALIVKAHQYFSARVSQWLDDGDQPLEQRADALSVALQSALQLVVIRLDSSEDSQEIFETLNARGTPLTAADLIKNFVFQRLNLEGEDSARVYRELWPFESKFWEDEVSVGRYLTTRSALFFAQWLVSRVGQEVSPRSTFTRFKFFVEHESTSSMIELLATIAEQAAYYHQVTERSWDKHADLDAPALHVYRMAATQSEISKPIFLWVTEPGLGYSGSSIAGVLRAVESWVLRRRLLRLQSSDLGRISALLIESCRGSSDADVVKSVEQFLAGQQYASTYWPGDEEVRSVLAAEQFYKRFSQPMQRVLLQAAEDWYRGYTTSSPSKAGIRVHRDKQQVEHLLPRSWKTHWPVGDPAAEADRDEHIHRLGNLTLITASLNSSVSNGPWLGDKGKRAALNRHDIFLMNSRIIAQSADGWSEDLIDARTAEITQAWLETWPVPSGHKGEVVDRKSLRTRESVTYPDLITSGALQIGTVLVCTDPRWPEARCEVLPGARVLYEGQVYDTPAAAAYKLRDGSGNAWWFWRVEGGPMLTTLRDRLLNDATVVEESEDAAARPADSPLPPSLGDLRLSSSRSGKSFALVFAPSVRSDTFLHLNREGERWKLREFPGPNEPAIEVAQSGRSSRLQVVLDPEAIKILIPYPHSS
ncbi:MAG: GmrSD restriction endonuclease domain-containing protein, partial [Coriobacteriia bacterium]